MGTNIPPSKVNIEDDLPFSKVVYVSSLLSTTFDPGVLIQMIVSTRKISRTKTKRSHLPGDGREFMRVGHPEFLALTRNMFSKMPETFRFRNYHSNLHRKVGYVDHSVYVIFANGRFLPTQLGKIVDF